VTQPQPRPTKRRTRDRRRAIIAAAERLFADRGYARTSMKQLAAAVGVADASLYNHFASKREILEALYEERGFPRALDLLEHLPGTVDMERQFQLNALASADLWAQNAEFLRVVFTEVLAGDALALEVHESFMERWRRGVERLFLIYAERGEADAAGATAFSCVLVDLVFGAFMDRMLAIRSSAGELPYSDPAFRARLTDEVAMLVRANRYRHAAPAP
jgi:AcrR family transcriptional regulator